MRKSPNWEGFIAASLTVAMVCVVTDRAKTLRPGAPLPVAWKLARVDHKESAGGGHVHSARRFFLATHRRVCFFSHSPARRLGALVSLFALKGFLAWLPPKRFASPSS